MRTSGMDCDGSAKIGHLVAARSSGRDQHIAGRHGLYRRKQTPPGDRLRHIKVLLGIAERSRHTATAGIQLD